MLSFITDLFPAVYAEEEKAEEVAVEEAEEEVAAAEEEEEEPEDIKPEIEEGKFFGFFLVYFSLLNGVYTH
jgi:ubiquinol-cytochrome c reductase subunit 6